MTGHTVTYSTGEQTAIDVCYPTVASCPGGWPVIILVHPLGTSRTSVFNRAEELSSQGYFTAAYDVAGQGAATADLSYYGQEERLDLAEIVGYLDATYSGGLADMGRMGISGSSQGGCHAWLAAAWSGKTLPANGRGITTFPTFRAAVPKWAPPVDASHFNALATTPFQVRLFSAQATTVLRWQPGWFATANAAIATESFFTLPNLIHMDPWRADVPHLATSAVPVLAHLSFTDAVFTADDAIRAFATMPGSTPKRLFLSPPGHGEIANARQALELKTLEQRWFDRFLKGVANQVDLEPPIVSAVVPEAPLRYSKSALFWNRHLNQWPPADVVMTRHYLREAGRLSVDPPVTAEPMDMIRHNVPAGANMAALMAVGQMAEKQLQSWFLPASSTTYDTPVLTSEIEIAGSIRLELEVTPTGPDYQVGCLLLRVDPGGDWQYVQSAVALERGNGSPQRLVVDFPDVHAWVPSGSWLRLRLQNVATRRPAVAGAPPSFRTVPYFQNVNVRVVHTGMRPSWIEIPVREVAPALTSPVVLSSVTAPRDVDYLLEGGARLAGSSYIVLFGMSGIVPPTPLGGGGELLLNVDPLTSALAGAVSSPLLPGCAGTLSANGWATAAVLWSTINPFPQQLHRVQLNAAALVLNNGSRASNPVDFWFR